jgi:hypothetical protein
MAHPYEHAESSCRKWGGQPKDYLEVHEWLDATKSWVGHSMHRCFRHHSEGIFEAEKLFGIYINNSDEKKVFVRYIAEQHVKEDCNGYIPSAKEWLEGFNAEIKPKWMLKTLNIKK